MAKMPKKKKAKKERSCQHKAIELAREHLEKQKQKAIIEKIQPKMQQFEIPVPREEVPTPGKEGQGA